MSSVELILFREADGKVPFLEWFDAQEQGAKDKCFAKLKRLEDHGVDLRRPLVDYLQDEIYELRIRYRRINYRILYFFSGTKAVVISHGLTKEQKIPKSDLERAVRRKNQYGHDPTRHSFKWER